MGKKTVILDPETKARILAGESAIEIEVAEPSPAPAAGTAPATAPAAPTAPTAPAAPAAENGVVAYLTGEIAKKDQALTEAAVKIAALETSGRENAEALPGLLAIAQGAIGNMQVALGGSDASKAFSAKDAVAEHARLKPLYEAKFKPGGLSASGTDLNPAPAAKVSQEFLDRRAAMLQQANAK